LEKLTETEARAQNRNIRVAKIPMSDVAPALKMDEARGFMKAIVDADTKQILGCAILGIEGGELADGDAANCDNRQIVYAFVKIQALALSEVLRIFKYYLDEIKIRGQHGNCASIRHTQAQRAAKTSTFGGHLG
jgi:hypothetical protein